MCVFFFFPRYLKSNALCYYLFLDTWYIFLIILFQKFWLALFMCKCMSFHKGLLYTSRVIWMCSLINRFPFVYQGSISQQQAFRLSLHWTSQSTKFIGPEEIRACGRRLKYLDTSSISEKNKMGSYLNLSTIDPFVSKTDNVYYLSVHLTFSSNYRMTSRLLMLYAPVTQFHFS